MVSFRGSPTKICNLIWLCALVSLFNASSARAQIPEKMDRPELLEPCSDSVIPQPGTTWNDWSSKGGHSLEIDLHKTSAFTFRYSGMKPMPKWIRLDTMIPPAIGPDELNGHIDLIIGCPEQNVEDLYLDTLELSDIDQGAFVTGAFKVSKQARARLPHGCKNAEFTIEIHTNPDLGFLLFDRFELGSFSTVNRRKLCGYPEVNLNEVIQLENGLMDFQLWRQNTPFVDSLQKLADAAASIDGNLGLSVDNEHRVMSVVVDRSKFNRCGVERLRNRIEKLDLPFDTSIRPSCASMRSISRVQRKLRDPRAFPDGVPPSYLDQDKAQLVILVPPKSIRRTDKYLRRWKGLYRLVPLTATQLAGPRNLDTDPHYGGASIDRGFSTCTAGFIVRDAVYGRGAVTAGHCFTLAKQTSNLDTLFSAGLEAYGRQGYTPYLASSAIASWDVGFIRPDGETFSRDARIHTSPGYPSSRKVVGVEALAPGTGICVSGRTSGARCGLKIIGKLSEPLLVGEGLMKGIWLAKYPGGAFPIVDKGDSGGPIYIRLNGDKARIAGMIVGTDFKNTVYFLAASDVAAELGVEIETSL